MNNCAPQFPHHEGRQQPRTHLFVLATLYSDAGSTPVHIRNMSPTGALIEAAVLPAPGSRVSLKRGHLNAMGRIAWRDARRAGVSFDATVHVADWMSRQVSAGQQRVDAIVASVRKDGTTGGCASPSPISIEVELATLRAELGQLESTLTEDAVLIASHPEIQTIDISLQRIDRILEQVRARG